MISVQETAPDAGSKPRETITLSPLATPAAGTMTVKARAVAC